MDILIENLHFSYELDKVVLSDININIKNIQSLSIVGVSGSGKSTLLKLMSSLINKNDFDLYKGKILINDLKPSELLKSNKLSFMFQEEALHPNRSAFRNIELPLEIKKKNEIGIINDLIKKVGLDNFKDYLPKNISPGMRSRVALAMSFSKNPEILMLDEPFSSLDIGWKTRIYSELQDLNKKYNTTTILVTHDIDEALKLSEKILILGIEGTIIGSVETDKDSIFEQKSYIEKLIVKNHSKQFLK